MLDHERKLARWSEDHDGILTVRQWAGLGGSPSSLKRRVAGDVLVRERSGVYRHVAHPSTFEGHVRAAVMAAGDDAYVSGPSLMRLYGARGEWIDRPEVTLVGKEHLVLPGVRLRRIDRLSPIDVRERCGLPALAPALGLLLLGATTSAFKVQTAVHDLVFQGFTTRAQLIDVLVRYGGRGRRGTVKFRNAVRTLDPGGRATQTNLELRLVHAAAEHGLPEPHLQLPVVDATGRRRRLDVAWPEQMLDVETDGDRWHLNPRDQAAMAARDEALAAVGWTTLRFRSAHVHDHIAAVITKIRPFFGS